VTVNRTDALNLLTLSLPSDLDAARKNATGLFIRIEIVHNLIPFLTEQEAQQAQAWLQRAEALKQQLEGGLIWQESQHGRR
jgi:hypothetical protein